MILPDVNIFVHAFRGDSKDHQLCRSYLDDVVGSGVRFGVSKQVLSGVVRVATHPRVFVEPSALDEALGFCSAVLEQPSCRVVTPGPHHWDLFSDLCKKSDARGYLVPDAWFAALAIESCCQWISLDRDFARFPGLNWALPEI